MWERSPKCALCEWADCVSFGRMEQKVSEEKYPHHSLGLGMKIADHVASIH